MDYNLTDPYEFFGNYVLLKKLAEGGMAEVFLARPASVSANGRVLVIKRVLPKIADNPVFLKMFEEEIQLVMGFNHPHTVQIHDFGEVNRQPFIAMEYIAGKNLRQVVDKFRSKEEKMPVPMVLSLIAQAASGLSYTHSFKNQATGEVVNAIHRDISPQNLILSYDGNLKVIDFGIAKAAHAVKERSKNGMIEGKLGYLSPEQVTGAPLGAASDIFALGVVAWELLAFRRLFYRPGDPPMSILARITQCDQHVIPPSRLNPEVPAAVDEIILKALRCDPGERYSNAAAFQQALRQLLVRFYPDYSYSDSAQLMHALFEEEISHEEHQLRELNEWAQESLTPIGSARTASANEEGFFSDTDFVPKRGGGLRRFFTSPRAVLASFLLLAGLFATWKARSSLFHPTVAVSSSVGHVLQKQGRRPSSIRSGSRHVRWHRPVSRVHRKRWRRR